MRIAARHRQRGVRTSRPDEARFSQVVLLTIACPSVYQSIYVSFYLSINHHTGEKGRTNRSVSWDKKAFVLISCFRPSWNAAPMAQRIRRLPTEQKIQSSNLCGGMCPFFFLIATIVAPARHGCQGWTESECFQAAAPKYQVQPAFLLLLGRLRRA